MTAIGTELLGFGDDVVGRTVGRVAGMSDGLVSGTPKGPFSRLPA